MRRTEARCAPRADSCTLKKLTLATWSLACQVKNDLKLKTSEIQHFPSWLRRWRVERLDRLFCNMQRREQKQNQVVLIFRFLLLLLCRATSYNFLLDPRFQLPDNQCWFVKEKACRGEEWRRGVRWFPSEEDYHARRHQSVQPATLSSCKLWSDDIYDLDNTDTN